MTPDNPAPPTRVPPPTRPYPLRRPVSATVAAAGLMLLAEQADAASVVITALTYNAALDLCTVGASSRAEGQRLADRLHLTGEDTLGMDPRPLAIHHGLWAGVHVQVTCPAWPTSPQVAAYAETPQERRDRLRLLREDEEFDELAARRSSMDEDADEPADHEHVWGPWTDRDPFAWLGSPSGGTSRECTVDGCDTGEWRPDSSAADTNDGAGRS